MLKIEKQIAKVLEPKLYSPEGVHYKTLVIQNDQKTDESSVEYWTGKFVGQAKEFIDIQPEGSEVLVSGEVHIGYDKNKGMNFPYVLVTDAEPLIKQKALDDVVVAELLKPSLDDKLQAAENKNKDNAKSIDKHKNKENIERE